MRFLSALYHVSIVVLVLTLILGVFGVVVYVLAAGLLEYFFQVDLGLWIEETIGVHLRELFDGEA